MGVQASLKPKAHVKRDGAFLTIDAALLVPGDLVLLGSGGAVPADCLINHGQIDVDQVGRCLPHRPASSARSQLMTLPTLSVPAAASSCVLRPR